MKARWLVALLAGLWTSACGPQYVARGADLYAGGHYIEAAEVFERTESRLEDSPPEERARYGLYRGATLLALGDAPRAELWLAYSDGLLRQDGRALSAEERVMLVRARAALARRPELGTPRAEGPAIAATEKLPLAPGTPGLESAETAEPAFAPQ